MDTNSPKKVNVSYVITSVLMFFISAAFSMSGMFESSIHNVGFHLSNELIIVSQMLVVLVANFILHAIFYYGGFKSSPITRGLVTGTVLGVAYFLAMVFVFDVYNLNTEPMTTLLAAVSGRVVEYGTGGIATAVISVSDVHKWGLLRAF